MNMQWSMMPPTLYASWVPMWVEILITLLLVAGGLITLIGSLGLLRMNDFFQRLHGPSMGNTLGAICILLGSMLFFSFSREQLVVHEVLIILFILMTAPVVGMLLARAALYRKHSAAFSAQVKERRETSGVAVVESTLLSTRALSDDLKQTESASPAGAASKPQAHADSLTAGLPPAVKPGEPAGDKPPPDDALQHASRKPDNEPQNKTPRRPE